MNISRNLEQSAFHFPNHTAIREKGIDISYAQLNERANRIASALIGMGVSPGDHIALCAPNSIEWMVFYFGVLKTGAFEALADLKRRGYPIMNSKTHMGMMQDGPPVYRCHWPKFMLPVEANGDIVDCMHWGTRPVGNLKQARLAELLENPRLKQLAGATGEKCHKCVSIHRVEISEVCSGNLEPITSWRMLKKPSRRLSVLQNAFAR